MTVLWASLALIVGIFLGLVIGYAVVSVRWHDLDAKKQADLALLEEKKQRDIAEVARLKTWAEETVRSAKDWANAEVAKAQAEADAAEVRKTLRYAILERG